MRLFCSNLAENGGPFRSISSEKGSDLVKIIPEMPTQRREDMIQDIVSRGSVPGFLKTFSSIRIREVCKDGVEHEIELRVTPDYLSIGCGGGEDLEIDFVRVPLFPTTAQKIADSFRSLLPSRKIVNAIQTQAVERIIPSWMSTTKMTSTSVFVAQNLKIEALRRSVLGSLVSGHKKDIVITNKLYSDMKNQSSYRNKVAIYGWFLNGKPIQGLNVSSHSDTYVDYSHGVRLVALDCKVDGKDYDLVDVYRNPILSQLVSDEGPILHPYYAR